MSAFDDYLNAAPAPTQGQSFDAYLSAAPASGPQAAMPAARQPGMLASLGQGISHGFGSGILGAQQLIGHGLQALGADNVGPALVNDANARIQQNDATYAPYQQANPKTALLGDIGGNVLATLPLGLAAPEAAGASALGRLGVGGALGAANGAVAPVSPDSQNYWGDKLGQVGTGAAFGAGSSALTGALGDIIQGANGAPQRALADAGVTMTPGQILGGGWARTEEKLSSVPILGDLMKNAQQRSVQDFNRAAYNEALAPIGQALPAGTAAGGEAVQDISHRIGAVYDSIVPRAQFVPDQNFQGDLQQIQQTLAQRAPATLNQFDNIVDNQITQKAAANQGVMTGQQWNNSRAEISGIARSQITGNATPDNRALADALGDLNTAMNAGVARSSPPDIIPTLQNANAAWARYKQIETAAGSAGASNNGNVFTAAQFANAVRKGSTSAQKAANTGLNADLAEAGQTVLGSKYPDSGTPGRAAIMSALGALTGHAFLPSDVAVPLMAGTGIAALPYTALGQRAAQAALMARPVAAQPVGQFVGQGLTPFSAALGAALANH